MPYYPDYIIQEVAEKNDIYEVVSQYVNLKKAGSSYIGLCPFHNEKTPSFSVSPRRGIFKCFGCGEGGDVIRFIMKYEGISFHEAVKNLASRVNIILPEIKNNNQEAMEKKKNHDELMFTINKDAAEFFYNNIKSSKNAIEYFKKRRLDSKVVKYFWLGFSQDSWTSLFDYLKAKGYTEGDIYDSGLIKRHESGRYYDTFRNRIMFTIFDINNNIIGFGGRVLDNSKPKYLNSNDSQIFNKGRNLYSLNIAKHSKKDFVILCEGYMDAIALIKSGYENTVATLGTALTVSQAKIICKFFKEVVICYDSDEAGRKATNRAITVLREFDIKISVLNLKMKKDPDEYINKYGKEGFDIVLSKRKVDMLYLIDYFGEKYDLKKSEDIIAYVSDLVDYFKLIKSDVEFDVYSGIVCDKTGVMVSSIRSQVGIDKANRSRSSEANADVINVVNKGSVPSDKKEYLEKTRSLLLGTLFYERKIFEKYRTLINIDMFENKIHKIIYEYICECFEKGENVLNSALINKFDNEDDIKIATGILALDIQCDDSERAVSDYINQIQKNGAEQKAYELLKQGEISFEEFNNMINNKR